MLINGLGYCTGPPFALCSATHLLPMESTPPQCEFTVYWQLLKHAAEHLVSEHNKYAQWVTYLVTIQELGVFSACRNCVQILATRGHCIIMLQHKVMAVGEWHDNWSQDLIVVLLCIPIAINEMHFCVHRLQLMAAHNTTPQPFWDTLFTSLMLANCSPHSMPYTLSICTVR